MTRTGKPYRIVMVGWTLSDRPDNLFADLRETLRRALAQRLDEGVLIVVGAGFRTDAQQRREDCSLKYHAPMVVDLVFDAGIALRIAAGLIRLPIDRLSIGSTLRMRQSC